jgi:hypothetical protein
VDDWTCDVLEIDKVSGDQALRFVGFEVFNKYEITEKFNVRSVLFHIKVRAGVERLKSIFHHANLFVQSEKQILAM